MSTETPPPFDGRPSIRIDHTMPENRKVVGLSDAAFRLFIEALCWCSRQESDGDVPAAAMKRLGKPKTIKELVDAGLVDHDGGPYRMHDYLNHQRSGAEIAAFRDSKKLSGQKGAHKRWHVPQRRIDKDCPYCNGSETL